MTANPPNTFTSNSRLTSSTGSASSGPGVNVPALLITTPNPCSVQNYTFNQAGVLSPLIHGVPTTTTNLEMGGDGGYAPFGTFRSRLRTAEFFNRFSYDITPDMNAYVQASWSESASLASSFRM